jgi:hypothetical protein
MFSLHKGDHLKQVQEFLHVCVSENRVAQHSCLVLSEVLSLISSMSYIPLYPHGCWLYSMFGSHFSRAVVNRPGNICASPWNLPSGRRSFSHRKMVAMTSWWWMRWALTFCWNQLFCNIYIYLHHIYSSSHIYNIYIYGKQTTKLRWQTHVSSRFGMMIPNCWMFFTTNELMDNYWRSVENHHWTDPQTTSYFGCVNHVLLGSTKPVDPYPNQPFRSHISIFLGKNLQVIGCVEQLYLVFHFESKSP